MRLSRLLRHLTASNWRTRLLFPASALDAIEQSVTRSERAHGGEIRLAIETALPPPHVLNELLPRHRAEEVFAQLKVWDTEANNGVLIYIQVADRDVEIVADRGFNGRVSAAEWEAVCRLMEGHFREGRFEAGAVAGVEAVGNLIARHFSAPTTSNPAHNELPDRPTLL